MVLILLIFAMVAFAAATFIVQARVNLMAAGLFLVTLAIAIYQGDISKLVR